LAKVVKAIFMERNIFLKKVRYIFKKSPWKTRIARQTFRRFLFFLFFAKSNIHEVGYGNVVMKGKLISCNVVSDFLTHTHRV
jgi:hypothetical protein